MISFLATHKKIMLIDYVRFECVTQIMVRGVWLSYRIDHAREEDMCVLIAISPMDALFPKAQPWNKTRIFWVQILRGAWSI